LVELAGGLLIARTPDETHCTFAATPDKDPHLDGTGLRFETMEHRGKYPDTIPQAIKLIDAEGRSCIYEPIRTARWLIAKGLHSIGG
jgi:hypothetical protein